MTSETPATCALCGTTIGDGEAWLANEAGERAHSGCVYREADTEDRDRWMPPETAA
jgi:hypothetical protein